MVDEKRLSQLRKEASILEPNRTERQIMLQKLGEYVHRYLDSLPELPTLIPGASDFPAEPFSDQGQPLDKLLQDFEELVNQPGLKPGAPGYLAFIPGGGLFASALGDFLAAITNKYAGIYFAAPGAVQLERSVLRWLARLVGYPASARGDLTSGGSLAHLAAIVTAREAFGIRSSLVSKSVVYLTEQTHHSVAKALRIAGLDECLTRKIPLDSRYKMQPDKLADQIASDRRQGLKPFLVVASAGTTDTGSVDPLEAIAEVCQQNNVWLHVDAAYGGAFALCPQGKKILKGLEQSDSLILDPHKGLFLPFGTGAVLVQNGDLLKQAHAFEAAYLNDKHRLAHSDEPSPADLSAELSRHFRGLRLWLPLKLHGVGPFRAALEEKLLLARYAHQELLKMPGFEPGPEPDLTIVPFRYIPRRGNADEFNRWLIAAVQQDGRIFISSTIINGTFTLRLAVLGFRTHKEHVDLALELLQSKATELEKNRAK